ncbi:transposable element Tcb1 transposase [Trichonephila clavipes]|nr:transposable element Tcb1 transposase [Trichonephila clavipes]
MSSCRSLRGGIIGMMEAGWSARRVARQLGRSDCVGPLCLLEPYEGVWLKDIWDHRTHYVLPLTHRRLVLEWCRSRGNWTAAEWKQVVFSDESRFNLSSDDNRVCVFRPRGECLNPVFALHHHTDPTAGMMVWGAIAYNTRSCLVLIRGSMTAQRAVSRSDSMRRGGNRPTPQALNDVQFM